MHIHMLLISIDIYIYIRRYKHIYIHIYIYMDINIPMGLLDLQGAGPRDHDPWMDGPRLKECTWARNQRKLWARDGGSMVGWLPNWLVGRMPIAGCRLMIDGEEEGMGREG